MSDISVEHQVISNRETGGKLVFRIMGALALSLALVSNPVVLRPRFWNATVIVRGVAIEATLIAVGIGLLYVRKWAAINLSVVAALLLTERGLGAIALCILLILLILTVAFWPALVRGKRRDLLYVLVAVLVSVITQYVAFVLRPT